MSTLYVLVADTMSYTPPMTPSPIYQPRHAPSAPARPPVVLDFNEYVYLDLSDLYFHCLTIVSFPPLCSDLTPQCPQQAYIKALEQVAEARATLAGLCTCLSINCSHTRKALRAKACLEAAQLPGADLPVNCTCAPPTPPVIYWQPGDGERKAWDGISIPESPDFEMEAGDDMPPLELPPSTAAPLLAAPVSAASASAFLGAVSRTATFRINAIIDLTMDEEEKKHPLDVLADRKRKRDEIIAAGAPKRKVGRPSKGASTAYLEATRAYEEAVEEDLDIWGGF